MHDPPQKLQAGDIIHLPVTTIRGEYVEDDGSRLSRYAIPGAYVVLRVLPDEDFVELEYKDVGDRFECSLASLVEAGVVELGGAA